MPKGTIYLLPTEIGDLPTEAYVPQQVRSIAQATRFFIVENLRTARRYLKKLDKNIDIDSLTFFEMDKHSHYGVRAEAFETILTGHNVALMSEAGTPGIADPGAQVVAWAHQHQVKVVPLVGPSALLLTLMASGLNGQNFAFVGYLPAKPNERARQIKFLESRSKTDSQAQMFIEAPYRNRQLFADLLKNCNDQTLLCIGMEVNSSHEQILTLPVSKWKKKTEWIKHKVPAVFIIQA